MTLIDYHRIPKRWPSALVTMLAVAMVLGLGACGDEGPALETTDEGPVVETPSEAASDDSASDGIACGSASAFRTVNDAFDNPGAYPDLARALADALAIEYPPAAVARINRGDIATAVFPGGDGTLLAITFAPVTAPEFGGHGPLPHVQTYFEEAGIDGLPHPLLPDGYVFYDGGSTAKADGSNQAIFGTMYVTDGTCGVHINLALSPTRSVNVDEIETFNHRLNIAAQILALAT